MVAKYGKRGSGDCEIEIRSGIRRYKATEQLKQKNVTWAQSEIKPENFHVLNT